MSGVVTDDQNSHCIAHDAKEKMVGKAMQVHAAKVALANRTRPGSVCGPLHEVPQFAVKIVCKFGGGDTLVVLHDFEDIRVNLWMQDQPHQPWRAAIC